jgi:hypothetical protein
MSQVFIRRLPLQSFIRGSEGLGNNNQRFWLPMLAIRRNWQRLRA